MRKDNYYNQHFISMNSFLFNMLRTELGVTISPKHLYLIIVVYIYFLSYCKKTIIAFL